MSCSSKRPLQRLGFDPGRIDRDYDEDTELAVEALYALLGYPFVGLTDDERRLIDQLCSSVRDARSAVTSAQASLARALEPVNESTRLQTQAALDAASGNVDVATAAAMEAETLAAADVAAAVVVRNVAEAASIVAADRLAGADAGVHPDTGIAPTAEELEVLETEAGDAADLLSAAVAAVIALEATEARVIEQQDGLVRAAGTALAIAQAQFDELSAPPDVFFEERAVADAQEVLGAAITDLAELEAETGVRVPRAEVMFLDVLPLRVQRLYVDRGDVVTGTVMTVSGADITIESSISNRDRSLVKIGDIAVVDDESLGISFEAEITELASDPGGRAAEGRYYMKLTPVDPPGGEVPAGLNLRATIDITSTGGEVLAVPLAALSAGGDGSVRVEVETDEPGVTRTVVVTTGLESTGFVEVTSVEGSLDVGDRVVVGR